MDMFVGVFLESWEVLAESAPYVLFGFFAAGILKAYLPEQMVAKHLGSNSTSSVIKASLFGIPLPLCSCGVIPAAIELRKQGASKGASGHCALPGRTRTCTADALPGRTRTNN